MILRSNTLFRTLSLVLLLCICFSCRSEVQISLLARLDEANSPSADTGFKAPFYNHTNNDVYPFYITSYQLSLNEITIDNFDEELIIWENLDGGRTFELAEGTVIISGTNTVEANDYTQITYRINPNIMVTGIFATNNITHNSNITHTTNLIISLTNSEYSWVYTTDTGVGNRLPTEIEIDQGTILMLNLRVKDTIYVSNGIVWTSPELEFTNI